MAKFTLEDTIKTFSHHQALVVYWSCKDLSNENIAARFGYQKSWVVWQMSQVYFKLGLDRKDVSGRSLHWSERRRILREKVCPIIMRLTNDDPDWLERFPLIPPNVLEGSIVDLRPEIPVPPSEPIIPLSEPPPEPPPLPPDGQNPPSEPPPDFYPIELYNAWLAVLEDDERGDEPPLPVLPPIYAHPPGERGPIWGRLIPLGLAVLLGCLAVGALAYWLGRNGAFVPATETSMPTIQLTSTIEPSATIQLTITETSFPTDTLAPTLTFTPPATLTPIPTNTVPPIGLTEGAVLQDDRVTLELTDVVFNIGYDRLGNRRAPVAFIFDFTNRSGETIVVQFDSSNFVIEDNTGRTAECWFYDISGAVDSWTSNLDDQETLKIETRCGDGNVPPDVTMYTLTVHPFTSLPESTWVANVPR
jgi:hypothetical protein